MADNLAHPYDRGHWQVVTFNDLPDDVLVTIFDFHISERQNDRFLFRDNFASKRRVESWQLLVHVCRRWRGLVFGSPRRLNLQLFWIPGTCAGLSLDIWPALPLLIEGAVSEESLDGIVARLEQNDRICQIYLVSRTAFQIEKLWTAMEAPFPELTEFLLSGLSYGPVFPGSFLGGSALHLRNLYLSSIPIPGLPKLLLSATRLVCLTLLKIPPPGYISPETMASCLSVLTSLELDSNPLSRPLTKRAGVYLRQLPLALSSLL